MTNPILIDTNEENGLLVHRFRDPETGEEWEETEELGLHEEDDEKEDNEHQPESGNQAKKDPNENPDQKGKTDNTDQKKPGADQGGEKKPAASGPQGNNQTTGKGLSASDLERLKENPKEYLKEKAKQEAKAQLKKQVEEKGGQLLIETLPEWGPFAGGCLIVLILTAVIYIAFMMIAPEAAGDTTTAAPTKICLDAGHGGEDSGAIYPSGSKSPALREKDMNLTLVQELKPKLEKEGYTVILTRSTDVKLYPGTDNKEESAKRSEFCSTEGADLMYRIHLDASTEPQRTFHIAPGPKYSKISAESVAYAEKLHEAMIKSLGASVVGGGKVVTDGGVLEEGKDYNRKLEGTVRANELELPLVWLEAIAINKAGVAWINEKANRDKFTDSLAKGFVEAIPPSSGGSIVDKAKYYVNNPEEYKKVMVKTYTDCGGFVRTVIKETGSDPELEKFEGQAKDLINYFESHPEKYTIVSKNITSTKDLKPGDIILNFKFGSHTAIFIGESGKNKAEASLNSHGPEYGNWYNELHAAVRLK